MNYDKAQKEVFNALLRGDRVCGYKFDDDHFFVTADGYMGYIFPNNLIQFNTEKINIIKQIADITEPTPENELKLTLDFKAGATPKARCTGASKQAGETSMSMTNSWHVSRMRDSSRRKISRLE